MTYFLPELSPVVIEPLVRHALQEDLGRAGDITSMAIIPADLQSTLQMVAREPGVIAGMALAKTAFELMDAKVQFHAYVHDGQSVEAGTVLAEIHGSARALLSAERTALNYVCHLSGIASQTATLVKRIAAYPCKITCTRKTTPLLRSLEKYAVKMGGGSNHRFGLDDAVLIKDNHIAIAGSVSQAVERARAAIGHLVKIEVEVDTLEQLDEALAVGAEVILLDNMPPSVLKEAVRRIDGRAISEASGGITPETVAAVAASGVDLIAIGWITHSARIMDIGLDSK